MLDVLEHMPQPRAALAAASTLLCGGGVMLISCPNMDTAVWRGLDARAENPYWAEVEHYHNFTRQRLVRLVESFGFRQRGYAVSHRYVSGMELIFTKKSSKP